MQAPTIHIIIDETGTPRTINKGVKVHMIAEAHIEANTSVENIAEQYGITLADVYAALAYYHDNRSYYEQRNRILQPLIASAKQYTEELNEKIKSRLTSED